jgi:8-oxo-dGTP diphosphatase
MKKAIELIARAAAIRSGRILACQRLGDSYWALPGGHIEWGESVVAALSREMFEEAGLAIARSRLWFIHENSFGEGRKATHEIVFVFHVELAGMHTIKQLKAKEGDLLLDWIPLSSYASIDFRPRHLIQAIVRASKSRTKSLRSIVSL